MRSFVEWKAGAAVNLGAPELLIVLAVVMLLFGGAKLPKLARSLGQAQGELRKGMKEGVSGDEAGDPAPS